MLQSRYRTYIASDAWSQSPARFEALRRADFRCSLCNASSSEAPLQAHHRTYENVGCELPEDLTALCRRCHEDVTDILRARLYASMEPPKVVDLIVGKRAPLFDASFAAGDAA